MSGSTELKSYVKDEIKVERSDLYKDARDKSHKLLRGKSLRCILFFEEKEGYFLYRFEADKPNQLDRNVVVLKESQPKAGKERTEVRYYTEDEAIICNDKLGLHVNPGDKYFVRVQESKNNLSRELLEEFMAECQENKNTFLELAEPFGGAEKWELKSTGGSFSIKKYLDKMKGLVFECIELSGLEEAWERFRFRDIAYFKVGSRLFFERKIFDKKSCICKENDFLDVMIKSNSENRKLIHWAEDYAQCWRV